MDDEVKPRRQYRSSARSRQREATRAAVVKAATDGFIDSETGIFDVSKYITAMDAREKALQDYQTTLASSGLSAQAKSFLASEGEDVAAAQLAGYAAASPAQQAELNRLWTNAFTGAVGAATKAIPATVPGPDVVVGAPDVTNILKGVQNSINRFGALQVDVVGKAYGRVIK